MKPVNYRNSVHVRPVRGGAELRVYGGITVLFAKAKAVTQALQLKVPSMTVPSQVQWRHSVDCDRRQDCLQIILEGDWTEISCAVQALQK